MPVITINPVRFPPEIHLFLGWFFGHEKCVISEICPNCPNGHGYYSSVEFCEVRNEEGCMEKEDHTVYD